MEIHQHESGAKLDADKNRLGLVLGGFANALQQVGEIGTAGAIKYSPDGWKTVPNGLERYTDAMLRHLMSYLSGELIDPESQQQHLEHCCWNVLAMLELTLKEQKEKISNERGSM